MKKLIGILLLHLLFVGCNRQQSVVRDKIEANINVEIIPQNETIILSSIYEKEFDIISLDGILLSSVNKILKYDSLWVVEGKSQEGGAHIFDSHGKYINTIIGWGQGPAEAFDIWAMKMYKDAVYFLINAGTELVKYSLRLNEIELRFRLPDEIGSATDFEIIQEDKYIFLKSLSRHSSIKEYKLYIYNGLNHQFEAKIIELDKKASEYISFVQNDCLYRYNDDIRYYEIFRNGIVQLNNNTMDGYIGFTDNKYSFPEDKLYKGTYTFDSFIQTCKNSSYIWNHCNLYEGKRFISSTFTFKNEYFWNLIDKVNYTSNSYKRINDDLLLNEMSSVEEYLFRTNIQENKHYFTLSYYDLDEIIKNKKLDNMATNKIYDLYKTMNDGSNDLIICFYEKENFDPN